MLSAASRPSATAVTVAITSLWSLMDQVGTGALAGCGVSWPLARVAGPAPADDRRTTVPDGGCRLSGTVGQVGGTGAARRHWKG